MILAQYAEGDWKTLNNPNHIDTLRAKLATELKKDAWLECRKELIEHGSFTSDAKYSTYMEKGQELTRSIMASSRAVFCTVTTTQSPALYVKDKEGKVK